MTIPHPFNNPRPAALFAGKRSCSPHTALLFRSSISNETPFEKESVEVVENSIVSFQKDVRSEPLANLEAVLFLAREPLTARRLAQMAELPEGAKIRNYLRDLNERYDRRQSAFRIVEVAGGLQLRTRPEFAPWLARMQEVPVTVRLSVPAMETLAVIAYRQPVLRAEIERLRGVQCGELIRQLLERDLVRIVGRSEELGRPFFYGTTRFFLQVFGLGSLRDLPDREQFDIEPVEEDIESAKSTEL